METETFIAGTAKEALEKIRRRLGPEAKVLRVRRVPRKGLSGLFGGAQVEVVVQKPAVAKPDASTHIELIKQELARREPPLRDSEPATLPEPQPRFETSLFTPPSPRTVAPSTNATGPDLEEAPETEDMVLKALEGMGLTRLCQHRLLDLLNRAAPEWRRKGVATALQGIGEILRDGWRPVPPLEAQGPRHLLLGPAGVGKSALLGRRIVRHHLDEPETAMVAALDGTTANSCPLLQYQCEALGIRFERQLPKEAGVDDALLYYDTPGVDWQDSAAIDYWRARLDELGRPCVHLILNAAYDVALLIRQVRAFAPLGVADVSFTHTDEERNMSKLWNVVLGTGCQVRWLAGGQKIPGALEEAEAIAFLPSAMNQDR